MQSSNKVRLERDTYARLADQTSNLIEDSFPSWDTDHDRLMVESSDYRKLNNDLTIYIAKRRALDWVLNRKV